MLGYFVLVLSCTVRLLLMVKLPVFIKILLSRGLHDGLGVKSQL